MSQYKASIPSDGQVRPEIRDFFERFYQISDDPEAHEKYSEQFTKDGTLIMGPNETKGRSEIFNTRKGMWEKVARRSHTPKQIYAFGAEANDIMLYGHVEFELKDGRKTDFEWGARAKFAKEDGDLKMEFYQVFLDTGAVARAK